jgi:uncharacterized protein (TIGR03000 family)
MSRRWYVLGGMLTLAATVLLLTPNVSQAQRRGWGGGRGWSGGYGGWGNGYSGSGWGGYGYNGYGWGNRGYLGNYGWNYPSYGYSSGWYTPNYYNYDFGATVMPSYDTYGGPYTYSQPTTQYQGSEYYGNTTNTTQDRNAAEVNVRVPPNAQIWFEGQKTNQQGSYRNFISPPLDPGKDYTYDIRAQWTENGKSRDETKHVRVRAGQQAMVTFGPAQGGEPGGYYGTTPNGERERMNRTEEHLDRNAPANRTEERYDHNAPANRTEEHLDRNAPANQTTAPGTAPADRNANPANRTNANERNTQPGTAPAPRDTTPPRNTNPDNNRNPRPPDNNTNPKPPANP